MSEPQTETPTTEEREWMDLAYASLRADTEWGEALTTLFRDINRYLAFVDISRS